MITLDEARILQKNRQKTSIMKLSIPLVLILASFIIALLCTDIIHTFENSNLKSAIILIAIPVFIIIVKFSKATKFFAPREFIGEVINVYVYRTKVTPTSYAGRGHGDPGEIRLVAELSVKNENGRIIEMTCWNGDVASHLRPGDKIAILRFIDEPILINGKYWQSSI